MRRPRGPPVRVAPATPDGWQSIGLPADANSLRKPPNHSIHDSLGLAKPIHASQIKVPRVHDNNHDHVARDSPRHRKLQQQHVQNRDLHVADAFAANKSLRLARFETPNNTNCDSSRDTSHQNQQLRDREPKRHSGLIASPLTRAARLRECTSPAPVILHETIRGFDDAVDASPLAESNQVAITELFLCDWLDRFERERELYKSVVVHAEVAFRELHRMTARLALPNDVVTAFSCKIFDEMTEHFGPFSTIMRVLYSELKQAIYAPTELPYSSSALPYFAIVKNQKRILQSLRQELYVMSKWESRSLPTEDCNRQKRQERNDFLRYEINKVHATLLSFLDQCGLGLVRTIFREWYFVAVTSKRNSKKYVEYFSAWFGGSVKSLVPRVFLAWKHLSVERKVARMHEQLASDQEKLSTLQKRIDELTVQRNLAQLESLAIRNDRKHAEDTIQRLHRKIQSASSFLEVSQRREELVAQEGQLRVEAATFLPPLVLESLLRGFHNVGFLQPLHSEFALLQAKKMEPAGSRGRSVAARHKQPPDVEPSALQHCIAALQGMIVAHTPTLPSLEDAKTEEAHHTLQKNDLLVENRNSKHTQDSTATPTSEIPLHKCITLLHGMKSRVEDDRTAHLLFLSKADLTHSSATMSLQSHQGEITNEEDVRYASASIGESPHVLQELVELFEASLGGIRHQDEHYAKHAKLFSSRMLEQNEISVVPHTQMASSGSRPAINIPSSAGGEPTVLPSFQVGEVAVSRTIDRVLLSSIDSARFARAPFSTGNEDELNDGGVCMSLDQIPLLRARDFELSPQHTRAFIVLALGQLLAEYGSLLFSPADISAFVRNRMLQKVMLRGIAGGKHTFRKFYVPLPGDTDGEDGDGDNVSSDDEDTTDKTISGLSPNHGKSAKGGGILRKQTSQRQMQLAPRRKSSYRGLHAPIANDIDRGLSHLKTAYDVWNQLSLQLAQAEIVQARGFIASSDVLAVDERFSIETSALANLASIDLPADMAAAAMMLRPRLQLHIEPLPSGPLMNAAKDKDRGDAPTTPNGSHRRSMATVASSEWSYQTSKVRLLSLTDTQKLRGTVEALHGIVRGSTQSRAAEYASAKQTLRDVRCMQWHEACDLASHFTSSSLHTLSVATTIDPATEALAGLGLMEDDRRHVFECVGFDNDTIERLFSVEDHPQDELHRVQGLLERKKHILRHAFYCKHRPGITHATTLEDLWHVVKVLRLARDVRVLPTLRDEEVVGTYFNEQLFSPEDLAEVLLQLCNEQFLPHITPLSARVEFLLTHHLPLAMQNQSAIREIMHKTDVKKALSDHGQTLRTIFRRYCAKEKDILAAAAAKRRAAVVAANASVVGSAAASTAVIQSPLNVTIGSPPQAVGVVPPQGITRFMRLADWHAFIADYKLLRARFTAEYATVVFCNVQEAESGLEDNLEMIYGEFTEAIVALSVCFFPDPFLRHATRVHQFIRRYLPVSPEEIRDHHG